MLFSVGLVLLVLALWLLWEAAVCFLRFRGREPLDRLDVFDEKTPRGPVESGEG